MSRCCCINISFDVDSSTPKLFDFLAFLLCGKGRIYEREEHFNRSQTNERKKNALRRWWFVVVFSSSFRLLLSSCWNSNTIHSYLPVGVCCVAFWARRLYTYSCCFCWPVYLGLKRICCVYISRDWFTRCRNLFFLLLFPFSPLVDLLILCFNFHKSQVFFARVSLLSFSFTYLEEIAPA
jgi:hypothetical protein